MNQEREAALEIIHALKGVRDQRSLNQLKAKIAGKYHLKKTLSNIKILCYATGAEIEAFNSLFITKPVRTSSGVSPIAIMTSPANCLHGRCTFCPGGINSVYGSVPQSYTGKEPATMRGIRNYYDPYLQVFNRLEQYLLLNQTINKIELIIMGGTFPSRDKEYQEEFVKYAFKAMNDFSTLFFDGDVFNLTGFKEFFELPAEVGDLERTKRLQEKLLLYRGTSTLEEEQTKNEHSFIRCVALCIETKPDAAKLKEGNELLRQGCTRVELGIQSVYNDVLTHVNRGHTVEDTIESIRTLKDLGFKISGHWMPGLPLTSRERDVEGFKTLFSSSDFRPDMLKIYPCMVGPGTKLHIDYKKGLFTPLSTEEAALLIAELKPFIPRYCRVQRIQRDVPTKQWSAGVGITNLRQYIHEKYKPHCECISCREPRGNSISTDITLDVFSYEASCGTEFFISLNDAKHDFILGFCRLRFPSQCLREEITSRSALLRELHVYGVSAGLNTEGNVQHKGLGKRLMLEAEKIANTHGKTKMVVLSGVGVREYYQKIGYEREGPYMVKNL